MENLFLAENELNKFGKVENLSQKVEALLNQQKANWELVKTNFESLSQTKIKKFQFKNSEINIQFNPARITSTSAKVDKKSIEERKCFLCLENLPSSQKGILFNNDYLILCNPFPIFKQHLTIPKLKHIPQNIENNFRDLLELSEELHEKFFVFYNGPKCGASAPDHFHFQAGLKNEIPIYSFINSNETDEKLFVEKNNVKIFLVNNEIQNFLIIKSNNRIKLEENFYEILNSAKRILNSNEEPLINILSFYENDIYKVIIFFREKHRPTQYFEEGEKKLLVSPASVDLGGLIIVPREEDFNKITRSDIENIFKQVHLSKEILEKILSEICK
ncbi:MAG: DUF4922 domain-containing protein [Ignavibacteriae bacterium]|nr:DUF4922 domain-containing protein [Ignavibacteriota bacterium]